MTALMDRAWRDDRPQIVGAKRERSTRFLLLFSIPMTILAVAGSLAGIFIDETYSKETENWAAQAVAQDIVNLVAFSALLFFAVLASRGSLRAYLAWLGVVVYGVYTYAIFAFAVHFGPLFLVYVAVFGLSIYALVVGLVRFDYERMRETTAAGLPIRFTAALLLTIGVFFYFLWPSSIVPSVVVGEIPVDLEKAGLLTNPVHVLDLAVFLPAMLLAGALLLRRHLLGYVLAPVVLGAAFTISLGIVVIQPVLAARSEDASWGVGGAIAVVAIVELVTLIRFLRAIHPRIPS